VVFRFADPYELRIGTAAGCWLLIFIKIPMSLQNDPISVVRISKL